MVLVISKKAFSDTNKVIILLLMLDFYCILIGLWCAKLNCQLIKDITKTTTNQLNPFDLKYLLEINISVKVLFVPVCHVAINWH